MIVSPNVNVDVIKETKKLNEILSWWLHSTECFGAIDSGSDGIKLFQLFLWG